MGSTVTIVLLVAGTGIFTALVTTGLLWLVAGRLIRSRLAATLDTAGDVAAEKVRRAVLEAVDEALPQVRHQVAEGVGEAGETILPRLRREVQGGVEDAVDTSLQKVREQVRSGVTDGIASAVAGGAVTRAGEEILRKSGSVLDAGLDLILGSRASDDDS